MSNDQIIYFTFIGALFTFMIILPVWLLLFVWDDKQEKSSKKTRDMIIIPLVALVILIVFHKHIIVGGAVFSSYLAGRRIKKSAHKKRKPEDIDSAPEDSPKKTRPYLGM